MLGFEECNFINYRLLLMCLVKMVFNRFRPSTDSDTYYKNNCSPRLHSVNIVLVKALSFIFMPATQVLTFDVAVPIRMIKGEMFRKDGEKKRGGKEKKSAMEGRKIKRE